MVSVQTKETEVEWEKTYQNELCDITPSPVGPYGPSSISKIKRKN